MGMYRDSKLGLCLDLTGPDGNVFVVFGVADNLARQLDVKEDWKTAKKALQHMDGTYITYLLLFKEFFPMVTLVGFDEIAKLHGVCDDILEED